MAVLLATFRSVAHGVGFYDIDVSAVRGGSRVVLQLEPTNVYDSKCVAVYLRSSMFSDLLGHLAREDAAFLAPLLRSGLFVFKLLPVYNL